VFSSLLRPKRRVPFVVSGAFLLVGSLAFASAGANPAISATPVSYTPWLLQTTPDQYVYEIDQCGGLMYAVGQVSSIGQGSQTYSRGNAFSFSATTGAMTAWDPGANAPIRSIAFSADCSRAYIGGEFTTLKGASANHIAEVDTTTGALIATFAHNANSDVNFVENIKGNILVGGIFWTINGASRNRLASLDPNTGAVTSYLTLPATGGKVWNSQISHDGNRMLVEGQFTAVGGVNRKQIFMLDLGPTSATLDNWYSTEFDAPCVIGFYVRDAAWSPDDQKVYIATTGAWPPGSDHSAPRTGLCDAAAAFPATPTSVSHTWINYTGCDSLYSVEATSDTVYIGGHERWANNPFACDSQGAGGLSRPGIAALSATTGLATSWNPTRALGYGADDLLITSGGLWVASDIFSDGWAQKCGGLPKHGGICFFPN
jgi:beta-propeller uncharacterized protein DUF5122